MTELANLTHKIEVSRRIIAGGARPGDDPVVHHMIVEELKKDVPEMERRLHQLAGFDGDVDRRA